MIEAFRWNQLTDAIRLYPLMERPGMLSAHAYVIELPEAAFVVDFGGTPERARQVEAALADVPNDKPIYGVLTHCHFDHIRGFLCLDASARRRIRLVLTPKAAAILRNPDDKMTCYELYGEKLAAIEPDEIADSIRCGGRELCRMIPTPGHSPDSTCILIAGIAFMGDTLGALHPGVAGFAGWNFDDFKQSLILLADLARTIRLSCHGHEPIRDGAETESALVKLLERVDNFRRIETVTPERIAYLRKYAAIFMPELSRLVMMLHSRFYLLAESFRRKGNESGAAEVTRLIDELRTEDFLEATEKTAALQDVILPLRAYYTAHKSIVRLKEFLTAGELEAVVDPRILDRIDWLMNDFVNTFHGVPRAFGFRTVDLNVFLPQAVATVLGKTDLLSGLRVEVDPAENPVEVALPTEEFTDALADMLEMAAASVISGVRITVIEKGAVFSFSEPLQPLTRQMILNGYVRRVLDLARCTAASDVKRVYLVFA